MQNFAKDEFVPLSRPYYLLSQYVISIAPAFCVINMALEGSFVKTEVFTTKHHGRLQNPRSLLLRDIRNTICTIEDSVRGDERVIRGEGILRRA